MSKIEVSKKFEKKDTTTVYDIEGTERIVDVILHEYIVQGDHTVYLQVDYYGNIYLKHIFGDRTVYYIVSLDPDDAIGVCLTPIKSPNIFRQNLIESELSEKVVKKGVIHAKTQSLRGMVNKSLRDMNDEQQEEYLENNEFANFDTSFVESEYYWAKYNDDDKVDKDEYDDRFYLNGVSAESEQKTIGIVYSDLLTFTEGTFDTILIQGDYDSHNVVSTIERIDGYCTNRLTVYSSGHFKANFIDRAKYSRLCIDEDTSELVLNKTS